LTASEPDKSTQSPENATGWPSFVQVVPGIGEATFPQLRFWVPDRTGVPEVDRERGAEYFAQALKFSAQPGRALFIADVLRGMFGSVGYTENGFIEALLQRADRGIMPPRLTDEEAAAMEAEPAAVDKLREIETAVAGAIEIRRWVPQVLYINTVSILSGRDGPHIGGAVTMLARMALNGSRH
jgi:hypothetical protein